MWRACGRLSDELGAVGGALAVRVLASLDAHRATSQPQESPFDGSHAPMVTPDDGRVAWGEWSGEQVYNRWRALGHTSSGVFTHASWHPNCVKVKLVEVGPPASAEALPWANAPATGDEASAPPGTLRYVKRAKTLYARCADGSWVPLLKVQLPGKGVVSGADFANGQRIRAHSSIGDGAAHHARFDFE